MEKILRDILKYNRDNFCGGKVSFAYGTPDKPYVCITQTGNTYESNISFEDALLQYHNKLPK